MKTTAVALAVAAALLLTGCVTSRQARTVKPTAFLDSSASLLTKSSGKDDSLLVYRKAGIDWPSYDKVVVDPVAIWTTPRSATLTAEELGDYQRVIDSFELTLRASLAKSYLLVDAPQTHTLRMQVAIVDGAAANTPLKVVKTVAPYANVADFLWTFATGKPAFAGEVSLEYMIRDAESDELLAAGADRRVGGNQLGAATVTKWGDVRNILTYWSELAAYRLCLDRVATDCQRPRAGVTD
jgi:hypothetical protein